jgi:hypothetical protein
MCWAMQICETAIRGVRHGSNVDTMHTRKHEDAMDRTTLAIKARKHWEEWLPNKTAELKAARLFGSAIQIAARRAQEEIADLMAQGYQEHEAAEMVLPKFILLKPEPEPDDDWAAIESAERERKYQEMMRPFVSNNDE